MKLSVGVVSAALFSVCGINLVNAAEGSGLSRFN